MKKIVSFLSVLLLFAFSPAPEAVGNEQIDRMRPPNPPFLISAPHPAAEVAAPTRDATQQALDPREQAIQDVLQAMPALNNAATRVQRTSPFADDLAIQELQRAIGQLNNVARRLQRTATIPAPQAVRQASMPPYAVK